VPGEVGVFTSGIIISGGGSGSVLDEDCPDDDDSGIDVLSELLDGSGGSLLSDVSEVGSGGSLVSGSLSEELDELSEELSEFSEYSELSEYSEISPELSDGSDISEVSGT